MPEAPRLLYWVFVFNTDVICNRCKLAWPVYSLTLHAVEPQGYYCPEWVPEQRFSPQLDTPTGQSSSFLSLCHSMTCLQMNKQNFKTYRVNNRGFKKRRRLRLRQRQEAVILLVKRTKMIVPHVRHAFLNNSLPQPTILDKLNGTLRPPLPPKSVMGKWRVLAFTHLHPWFGGEGAFLFHFILSKIVYEPLLGVTSSIWGNHDTKSALVRSKVTSSESTSPIQKINWARRHWKKTKCKWHFTLT